MVLRDKTPVETGVLIPLGALTTESVIRYTITGLGKVFDTWHPEYAAVEQVAWFGRRSRVTMPLSHVAGAITGFLLGRGVSTFLLLPTMKGERTIKIPRVGRGWSDHEQDAYRLAMTAGECVTARRVGASSSLRKLSAALRRCITAPQRVPGKR